MRKDKGLTGDLDRLPMLTWIMFLKFLDDLERVRQDEATLEGRAFSETLSAPYRWRDWNPASAQSSNDDGLHNAMTGDALIAFIAQDDAIRPDGQRGPGLFAHLRSLEGSSETIDRRDVIASVFRGTVNRMQSGYILRDVLDKMNEIHFASSDETHTLSLMYESMLREMRDAAKNSGEFYTPRPLVQMIVQAINPVLGETILDPAAGTGGFLVEAYSHLLPTCQTIDDIATLQGQTLLGIEAKPLPYLLCQMNLLLHGVEAPQIDPLNALRFRLSEIGDRERVDVILTNPPFGGEEEVGIQGNFPEDRQTAETALLFLQLVMRKLKRPGKGSPTGGRAGVVVPNSTLSEEGIAGRIKQDLLKDFNLHTVVRLPDGVFAPYTLIPTNVLFFDRSGPTDEVWFYEHPVPDGRRSYSKTRPLEFGEFAPFFEWLANPHENERAWKVSSQKIRANGFKLDFRNPKRHASLEDLPPDTLLAEASRLEQNIRGFITATGRAVEHIAAVGRAEAERIALGWSKVPLSEVLTSSRDEVAVEAGQLYPNVGLLNFGRGVFEKPHIDGSRTSAATLYRIRGGQFIYSRLFAFEGAYGAVPAKFDGHFVSNEFPIFDVDGDRATAEFLALSFRSRSVWESLAVASRGLGNRRQRVHPRDLLAFEVWLPPLPQQLEFVESLSQLASWRTAYEEARTVVSALESSFLNRISGEVD